jgi:hypothetical protein
MTTHASNLPGNTLAASANGESPNGDRAAAALRSFGPRGLVAIVVVLAGNGIVAPLSAVLVLVWARLSRTP